MLLIPLPPQNSSGKSFQLFLLMKDFITASAPLNRIVLYVLIKEPILYFFCIQGNLYILINICLLNFNDSMIFNSRRCVLNLVCIVIDPGQ